MNSEQSTFFKKSVDGILNHDGSVRVCKTFDVMQTIAYCNGKEIHLQNKNGRKYPAYVHKKLDLTFAEAGDTALVKFNCNKPYVIGFKKEMKKWKFQILKDH